MIFHLNHPLEGLRGADYNPRQIGEAELARLRHSLERLGVCKPIIVRGKTIVAGHQRTRSLRAIGRTHAPAIVLETITSTDEIRFNQLHNGTDFDAGDENCAVGPGQCEPFNFEDVPYRAIEGNLRGKLATVRAEICRLVERYGNWGAATATMSGKVIHAAQYALACRLTGRPCRVYRIPDETGAEAAALLGAHYGRFSYGHIDRKTYIQTYAQMHRLREAESGKQNKSALYETRVIPELAKGERILDFGCGQGDYVKRLRQRGQAIFGIEFFFRAGPKIDTRTAHRMIDEVALDMEHNGLFDVVLADSVLNSVDTGQAEADVMTCLNAFCRPGGRIYFSGRPRYRVDHQLRLTLQSDQRRGIEFLDEDGFTGLYREGNWFFQKFHSQEEAGALGARYIGPEARYSGGKNSWQVGGVKTIELPADECRAAITREFDLMWPEGRHVGRADRMLAAWDRARNTPPRSASSGRS
jgi:ParB family chromosome partitioning protein